MDTPSGPTPLQRCRFGPFVLDAAERRLLRDGEAVDLRPKAFDALVLLVARAGHLVSKDTFFAELWPRTIVTDASLNKCIWQLRQVLDGADGTEAIETVPKTGYRFVLPVTVDAPAQVAALHPPTEATPEPPPANAGAVPREAPAKSTAPARDRRPLRVLVAGSLVVLLLAVFAPSRDPAPTAPAAPAATDGAMRVLLVASIDDLRPEPQSAWLSPALAELSRAQFAGQERVRTITGETARDFGLDALRSARAGAVQYPDALRPDWRLSGSYLVLPATAGATEVQLQFVVADAADGRELAQATRRGLLVDLLDLVGGAGAELRDELGLRDPAESAWLDERTALPADPALRGPYAEGLAALRRFDALLATRLLQTVADRAPDFAPAQAALGQAWQLLGHDGRAREALDRAVRAAGPLPRAVRTLIAAEAAGVSGDWPRAIESLEALAVLYPEEPDYALRLAAARLRAGRFGEAEAALDAFLGAGTARTADPRAWFQRARARYLQGRNEPALEDARHARRIAEAARAPLLAAEAALHEGWSLQMLGRPDEAQSAYAYSRDTFAAAGHGLNAARAEFQALQLRLDGDEPLPAQEARIDALLVRAREAGARRVEASVLSLACNLYWVGGRRVEGRRANLALLALSRELGDRLGEGRALVMLGTLDQAEGATEAARQGYASAAEVLRASGALGEVAWALTLGADLERLAGRLPAAQALVDAARTALADRDDVVQAGRVDYHAALLELDRGRYAVALERADAAAKVFDAAGAGDDRALVDEVRAELQRALGRPDQALNAIEAARAGNTASRGADRSLWPDALAATLQAESGRTAEARTLVDRVRAGLPPPGSTVTALTTRIYLGEALALLGDRDAARALWSEVATDARRRALEALALEAELLLACDDAPVRATTLARAQALGLGRLGDVAVRVCDRRPSPGASASGAP